jgi:nitrogen fixation-related uncharacterized protein
MTVLLQVLVLSFLLVGLLFAFRNWITRAGQWLDDHDGRVTAIATLFIAALTAALVITANWQWQTTNRQLEDSEAAERAHLTVIRPVTVDIEAYPPKPTTAIFTIYNAGQSIANAISICADTAILARGPSPQTPIISQPNPSGGSLIAGEKRSVKVTLLFPPECADALKNNATYAWIQIVVSYIDIFGKKRVVADSVCVTPQTRGFQPCSQGQVQD